MLGHKVLFIHGQVRFAHYESIFVLADSGPEPTTPIHKIKKMKKKIFFSTIPTPGIEPTTKHFKADAKMT